MYQCAAQDFEWLDDDGNIDREKTDKFLKEVFPEKYHKDLFNAIDTCVKGL